MAGGDILLEKVVPASEKVVWAVTLLLYKNRRMEIAAETSIEGRDFYFDMDEAYRIVCDAKNKLEIMRSTFYFQEMFEEFHTLQGGEKTSDEDLDREWDGSEDIEPDED